MPSTTPFDQAYYVKYSGFSSSMLSHPSLSNANQKETYSHLATRVQNLATGDCPNKPLPSLCDANQRPYSTEENNHLMTGHFFGTSIPVSKTYNSLSQPVADATKSGRPPTVHREYDNLRYCSDQLLPKPKIEKFDGDSMDYWEFLNQFTCHFADWLRSQKKLIQHCSERVRQHIQHFSDPHDERSPYDLAWEELHRRYGQPHIIAQACEECLLEFPRLDRDIAEWLNKLSILMKRSSYALTIKE